jgi:uncharacterized membrane protein YcaP (DUF421 family)
MDIVFRSTVMFFAVFGLLRLLGKRELSQLTPFELVVLIVMGDLIQQGVTHNDFSVTGAVLAVATFAFWSLVLAWTVYLFPRIQDYVDGAPRILIRNGKLLDGNLRRDRLTRADVESEMRLAGISHMDKVAWAILEPEGRISFIRREEADGPPPEKEQVV